jgi:hypothetical protein
MFIRIAPALMLALLAMAPGYQDPSRQGAKEDKDPFRVHIRMHQRVSPKIAQVKSGSYTGTGVVIRGDGLIHVADRVRSSILHRPRHSSRKPPDGRKGHRAAQ